MKRLFEKYTEWEDFKNGMYDLYEYDNEKMIKKSVSLLSDQRLFEITCKKVVDEWKISTKVHLTNNTINKKAWLGQAACSWLFDVPELLTRVAWGKLTENERSLANEIADKIINSYLSNMENEHNTKLHF